MIRSYSHRYLLRTPRQWDPKADPRPIVFVHGLGLGLIQYNVVLTHLLKNFSDRPLLVLLQPQISQNIFHPRFLTPMTRHQTADRLAALLKKLGWGRLDAETENLGIDGEEKKVITDTPIKKLKTGITMLSHSKSVSSLRWDTSY